MEYLVNEDLGKRQFGELLADGFRRSGPVFYRTACAECSACIPIRIEPDTFAPSRSQQRSDKKNRDIAVRIADPLPLTEEKLRLYADYLRLRHGRDHDRDPEEAVQSLAMLHAGYPGIIELDYFLEDRLIGVGIVDEADNALSANYLYYDTTLSGRGIGTFGILTQIRLARIMEKRYYYLGFFLEENRKMRYKKSFRPGQIREGGAWKAFSHDIQK
ncbi:MAG: arginyltransferase [Thermodesulfovibrionales bacterium]